MEWESVIPTGVFGDHPALCKERPDRWKRAENPGWKLQLSARFSFGQQVQFLTPPAEGLRALLLHYLLYMLHMVVQLNFLYVLNQSKKKRAELNKGRLVFKKIKHPVAESDKNRLHRQTTDKLPVTPASACQNSHIGQNLGKLWINSLSSPMGGRPRFALR